jgi:hypothetical protein
MMYISEILEWETSENLQLAQCTIIPFHTYCTPELQKVMVASSANFSTLTHSWLHRTTLWISLPTRLYPCLCWGTPMTLPLAPKPR